MRIAIDADKCEGHSRCYALAPNLVDVDDLLILIQVFRETPMWSADGQPRPAAAIVEEVMGRGGCFVTLTSLCNSRCFFFGALIPLPAVRDFCVSAGLVVVFNWLILVLAVPAVLALEVHRARRGLCDSPLSLCCLCFASSSGAAARAGTKDAVEYKQQKQPTKREG